MQLKLLIEASQSCEVSTMTVGATGNPGQPVSSREGIGEHHQLLVPSVWAFQTAKSLELKESQSWPDH